MCLFNFFHIVVSQVNNVECNLSVIWSSTRWRLLARAVYKNPDFLFFDEATSALDAENEKKIVDNLNTFLKGKTVIVIAHRLSIVQDADQIIVLNQGEIVEYGSHLDLSYDKGYYYNLIKNQLELGI